MRLASKIEVAFDQGKILSGEKPQPICEIEFEIKRRACFRSFSILSHFYLLNRMFILVQQAKAKRGYQLGSKPLLIDWLNKWRDFLKGKREGSAVDSPEIKCCHENGTAIN